MSGHWAQDMGTELHKCLARPHDQALTYLGIRPRFCVLRCALEMGSVVGFVPCTF